MMGVSLCQWRFSIGTFYLKSVPKKGGKEYNGFYYKEHVYTMLLAGAVPLKIYFGLLTVFAYSFMFVSLFFISMTLYPYIKLLCDTTLIFRLHIHDIIPVH